MSAKRVPTHPLGRPFQTIDDLPSPTPFPNLCVHELLHQQAARTPHAEAIIADDARLTYAELAAAASTLATQLRALGVGPGKRVGLAVERTSAMIVAVWGIIEAGGAYVPIDPHYPRERIAVMLEDAALPWLLTQAHIAPELPPHDAITLCIEEPDAWPRPTHQEKTAAPTPDDLVYAMYTSGSTGRPKSATIHHKGIVNLVTDMAKRPGLTAQDTCAAVISLSHDMSVADIFLSLSTGARLLLINPTDAADPATLAAHLAREKVSYISATPTTFRMLLALHWQPVVPTTILMAGEALPTEIVGPLLQRGCRIWNGYGMTEASVYSTMTELTQPNTPVTIGGLVANTPIYILDEAQTPTAIGEIGELYVGGVGVGYGYLDRPAMSAAKFLPDPFSGGTMYRSGDLARWRADGDIECLGRKDQQVKIRGYRVELEEIEARLNTHADVAQAVVIAWEAAPGDKRLLAYLTTLRLDRSAIATEVRDDLAAHLPAYMVPAHYIWLDEIPLTPAGKLDRKALPTPNMTRPLDAPAPTLPAADKSVEAAMCQLYELLFKIQPIGIHDDFFRFGGHSLLAAQLIARVRDQHNITLPMADVFAHPTPATLAAHLETLCEDDATTAPQPIPREGAAIVSDLQRSQWFIAQLDPHHPEYHVNLIFRCQGDARHNVMQRALSRLVARHEILRTTYKAQAGEPTQHIQAPEANELPTAMCSDGPESSAYQAHTRAFFRRPFDLEKGPIWRAEWLACGDQHHLLLCVHHIAIDGWSIEIIFDELCALYALEAAPAKTPALPPLPLQYADYAHWQRNRLSPTQQEEHTRYWQTLLRDAPARIVLPGAGPGRPTTTTPKADTAGNAHPIALTPALVQTIRALAKAEGVTLFMVLQASFAAWLHIETSQRDLPIGTVFANRNHTNVEPLIGFLANTLVMRHTPQPHQSFVSLLEATRQHTLDAFAHQDLPFGHVVNALRAKRSQDQQALFNACFILQAPPTKRRTLPSNGAALSSPASIPTSIDVIETDNGAAPFDMTLQLWEAGEDVIGNFLCRESAIPAQALPHIADRYLDVLRALLHAPERPLQQHRHKRLIGLEQTLLESPQLRDVSAQVRATTAGDLEDVAYVVAIGALPDAPPCPLVPVSTLPLRRDGQLDVVRLARVPVLDQATLRAALLDDPKAHIQPWSPQPQRLHLTSLLAAKRLVEAPPNIPEQTLGARTSTTAAPPAHITPEAPLAILHGPALVLPHDAPTDLPGALRRAAAMHPNHGLTTFEQDGTSERLAYPALLADASHIAAGLQQAGVPKGSPVLLQLDRNIDFARGLWGCLLGGYVAVPLACPLRYDAESGASQKLLNAARMLGGPPLLGTQTTIAGTNALGLARDIEPLQSFDVATLCKTEAAMVPVSHDPDDLVLLLFTSGSTGTPKAVRQYHRTVLHHAEGYNRWHQFGPEDSFLNWLPMDHVGGLMMSHFVVVWCGAEQAHGTSAQVTARPLRWLDWIEQTKATYIWAPNFAFGLVVDELTKAAATGEKARRWDLSSVRVAMNAGEAIVPSTARAFVRTLAPHGFSPSAMLPAWGMSELCSAVTSTFGFRLETTTDDDTYVCVGLPIDGFSLRIADKDGETMRFGDIGRLLVKGASVTNGYHLRDDLNAQVFDDEGWFDTGDLGFADADGLTITGRSKDEIIVNGINFPSHEIEAAVETLDLVERSFTAACAVRQPGDDTDGFAIFFVPASDTNGQEETTTPAIDATTLQAIRRQVVQQIGISPALLLPVKRADIPKTDIGKIQRSKLKLRYEAGEFEALRQQVALLLQSSDTAPAWFFQRPWVPALPRPLDQALPRSAWLFCHNPDTEGDPVGLATQLDAMGIQCTKLVPGNAFGMQAPDTYQLRPGHLEDAKQLFQTLDTPDWLIHLWTCQPGAKTLTSQVMQEAQPYGALALQALVTAWKDAGEPTIQQWLVGTTSPQGPPNQAPTEHLPLLGLLATLPHEHPQIPLRHIAQERTEPALAHLLEEYAERQRHIPEVARHGSMRYVPRLQRVEWDTKPRPGAAGGQPPANTSLPESTPALALPTGAFIAILGGLGGLGQRVASWLQTTYGADLLLLGRTKASQLSTTQGAALSQLSQGPAKGTSRVAYASIDLVEEGGLARAVEAQEQAWGTQLRGVFHLAAVLDEEVIARITRGQWDEALSAKADGGVQVLSLLKARRAAGDPIAYIDFGSSNALFGGFGAGAYAASTRVGEGITAQLRALGVQAYHLIWGRWDSLGLSQDRPGAALAAQRGYPPIPARQGLQSMQLCLAHTPGTYIIGLDGSNLHIRAHLVPRTGSWEDADIAHPDTHIHTQSLARTALSAGSDRFGTALQSVLSDILVGSATKGHQRAAPKVSPRDQREQQIASLWKEALQIDDVGIDHNFFDLGGHSLLLTQLQARLEEAFGRDISILNLFRYTTIRGLAAYLAEAAEPTSNASNEAAQARGTRQRQRIGRLRKSTRRSKEKT